MKPWAKKMQLFLDKKIKILYRVWSETGHDRKEEGHFWTKGVGADIVNIQNM